MYNRTIVGLWYCVSSRQYSKVIQMYVCVRECTTTKYIYLFFFNFLFYCKVLRIVLCAISRSLLVICFTYSSVCIWRRQRHPTPVLLPGKSHGWRSLVGCSPWGHEELDTTERLHFHFSLSCTGEGNGNPLQYSCLENPRVGGAWWASIYGVAQSRT